MSRKHFSSIVSAVIAITFLVALARTPGRAQAAPALNGARSGLVKGHPAQPLQAPEAEESGQPELGTTPGADPAAGEPADLLAGSPGPAATAGPAAATAQCTPALRKIMPVGDSITRGTGDPGWNGYRKYLFDNLNALGYNIRFVGSQTDGTISPPSDHHEGHSGFHARDDDNPAGDVYHNIYDWLQANPADIVLLHISTNDVEFGSASSGEIGNILDEIDAYDASSGGAAEEIPVVVAQIINQYPPIGAVSSLNASIANLVNTRKTNWGDLLVLADMETPLYDHSSMYWDYLHPSQSGYGEMAQAWEQALYQVLPICAASDNNPASVLEDTPATLTSLLNNDAGGGLKITGVGSFSNGGSAVIVDNGAAIEYTPAPDYWGSETFQYTLNNGGPAGSSATATVTVAITAVNDAPIPSADAQTVAEEGTLTFFASTLAGNDSPGPADESWQSLSVTGVTGAGDTHGTVSLAAGTVTYQPEKDFAGAASFSYTVCDNGAPSACADGTVNVTVTNVNDAPTISTIPALSTPEDTVKIWNFTVNDVDTPLANLDITWSAIGNNPPIPGLVLEIAISGSGQNRTLTLTPAPNRFGTADVTITVSDRIGGTASTKFLLTVSAVNDPPTVTNPGDQTYSEGSPVNLQIQAEDPEGSGMVFSAGGLPAGLSIDLAMGVISGRPSNGTQGEHTVQVTVADNETPSAATTIEFTITITKPETRYIFMPLLLGSAYR